MFRPKEWQTDLRATIASFCDKDVFVLMSASRSFRATYDELHQDFVCSYDNGKTWQPCETNE